MICSCCRTPLKLLKKNRKVKFKNIKLTIKDEYYCCNCLGDFHTGEQAKVFDDKVKAALAKNG
jgi:hypothetical protein